MSLRTIGIDSYGRAIRVDEGPSAVASFAIRGGPIQDGPDSAELTRQRSARKKRREAERRDVAR